MKEFTSQKEQNSTLYIEDQLRSLRIIMDPVEAKEFITQLGNQSVALDFETTGLQPHAARVRLSCIFHPDTGPVLLDHMFCGSFNDMAKHMLDPLWLVYNAKFEYRWFEHAHRLNAMGYFNMMDVDFIAKAKQGGYPSSLARMCKRDLGIILMKEEQLSDWSQEKLTNSQLRYAATDAIVTYMLYEHWVTTTTEAQKEAAWTMQDAVPAITECEDTGMVLDIDVHMENIKKWEMKQALMLRRVRKWTPERVLKNPGSDKQVSDLIKTQVDKHTLDAWPKTAKTKQLSLNRKVVGPIAAKSPYPFSRWLNALIRFRYYRKYLNTYGETLITKQHLEDAITFRLNIGQAATIRLSSSSLNIQNIPRAPWVRRAFLPPQGFDVFVLADYSGIELRVLAELSGDKQLLQDVIYGNVHGQSAAAINHMDPDEFLAVLADANHRLYHHHRELRTRSKFFSFELIYGAQAASLSISLKCSIPEAEMALKVWAKRYPKAFNYRYIIFDQMNHKGYIPTIDGRTIYIYKSDRTMPVAANYGVQSAAASCMYRALYHVRHIRDTESNRHLIRLCATVHDELILGVMNDYIDEAKDILNRGMVQGWLDVFPNTDTNNLLELGSGPNWSCK